MKVYDVKVAQITFDRGLFKGYKHIVYEGTLAAAEDAARLAKERIVKEPYWWITNGQNADGEPNVIIEEME